MIEIAITIGLFSIIIVLFKMFEKYHVDNLQALIVNYIVAGTFAFFLSDVSLSLEVIDKPWFLHAAAIGTLFIIVFNFYAFGTQKVGIAIATVANKMSLVIPVIVSLYLYKSDVLNIYKILGLIFAIVGIVLASLKGGKLSFNKSYLWIILAIFIGQGIADSLFNDGQIILKKQENIHQISHLLGDAKFSENEHFFIVLFIFATLTGLIMLTGKSLGTGVKMEFKNIFWGSALGTVNYFCLYFMGVALQTSGREASEVFPMVSMGVVLMSAIIGTVLYKEKLSKMNWVGITFAILAIGIITFGKYIY